MREDEFVKLLRVDGTHRFGYIQAVQERGLHLLICMHEEGASKIEWDAANAALSGEEIPDLEKDLTDAEKRLLPLLARDLTTKEIGEELGISPKTVRVHLRSLKAKWGLSDRAQVIALAHGVRHERETATD